MRYAGFTVVELFFWLAITALIIGGFIYKQTKELQQETSTGEKKGNIINDLGAGQTQKERLIGEN